MDSHVCSRNPGRQTENIPGKLLNAWKATQVGYIKATVQSFVSSDSLSSIAFKTKHCKMILVKCVKVRIKIFQVVKCVEFIQGD